MSAPAERPTHSRSGSPAPSARSGGSVGADPAPRTGAPTAVERVRTYVRDAVMSGEIAEGSMLSENGIATELGVSRTPVREAFVQLQSLGYLRLYPKRGALVIPVSAAEIGPVIEARWVVERHGIEIAAAQRDPATLRAIAATLDAQRTHIDAGDLTAFADADRDFHHALASATGNPMLIELYDSMRDRQRRMTRGMVHGSAERAEAFLAGHRGIHDAIADGDAVTALARLRTHLDEARETLLS